MVALYERLQESGVALSQSVGFIVQEPDETGAFRVTEARFARVLTEPPEDCDEEDDYDPESDLILLTLYSECIFVARVAEGTDLSMVQGGGLVFSSRHGRVDVGQSEAFFASVAPTAPSQRYTKSARTDRRLECLKVKLCMTP